MSSCSTYLAQAILNHVLRGQSFTPPAQIYLALGFADFTADNVTASEVSAAWYARQQITSFAAPVGSGMSTSNSNALQFTAVTGSSVNVSHWGLYDAVTSGNLLAYGAFDSARVANVNNVIKLAASALAITFSGMFSVHLAQALINRVFRNQAYACPSPYLALYTTDPTAADAGAEAAGAWYARQSISSWAAPTGTGHETSNLASLTYAEVTGANVTVTHWALRDASTAGNLLYFKAFDSSQQLNIGDVFAGAVGDLAVNVN